MCVDFMCIFFYEPVHAQFYRINTCDCTHIYYSNFTYFIYIKINAHYNYCNSVICDHFVKMSVDNKCLRDIVANVNKSKYADGYPVRAYVVGCDAKGTADILFGTDVLHLGRCKEGAKADVISNKGKSGDKVLCNINLDGTTKECDYQLKVETSTGNIVLLTEKIPFLMSDEDKTRADQITRGSIQTICLPNAAKFPSTYSPICNFTGEKAIGCLFDIYSLSEGEPIEVKIL